MDEAAPHRRSDLPPLPLVQDEETAKFFDAFRIACRACSTQRTCTHVVPRTGYTWARLTCFNKSCRKSAPANLWLCSCLIPWRSCATHAGWPTHAQARMRFQDSPKNTQKRGLSSATPPVLPAKRARTAASSASADTALLPDAAASSSGCPRKRSTATEDRHDLTRRLLSKMPKLAMKFAHLATVTTQEDIEN